MERPQGEDSALLPGQWDQKITEEYFRNRLKQVVTIHHAMFEKLLFEPHALLPEVVQLLEDAGKAYLKLSREIEHYYDGSGPILNSSLKPES